MKACSANGDYCKLPPLSPSRIKELWKSLPPITIAWDCLENQVTAEEGAFFSSYLIRQPIYQKY